MKSALKCMLVLFFLFHHYRLVKNMKGNCFVLFFSNVFHFFWPLRNIYWRNPQWKSLFFVCYCILTYHYFLIYWGFLVFKALRRIHLKSSTVEVYLMTLAEKLTPSHTKLLPFIDRSKPISYLCKSDLKSSWMISSVSKPVMVSALSLLECIRHLLMGPVAHKKLIFIVK